MNGSHVSVSGRGVSVSAAAKAAAGDSLSVFAANSGYVWNESGSSLFCLSLCQIFLYWSYDWASWGCNRTHGCGSNCSCLQIYV